MLREALLDIWKDNENCVILFNWYHFLVEESLETLGLSDRLDISSFVDSAVQKYNKEKFDQ